MTTYTWTGDADATSWSNAGNWTPTSGPPGAADNAIVDVAAGVDGDGASVDDATFENASTSLTSISGTLTGTLSTTTSFSVLGDDNSGAAYVLTLQSGGKLNASNSSPLFAAISIDNNATLDDFGAINQTQGGVNVGYLHTGALTIEGGGTATFENTVNSALTVGDDDAAVGTVTVTGKGSTLTVESGNPAAGGGGANIGVDGAGQLDIDDGGLATFANGLFLGSNASTSYTGQGTVQIGSQTSDQSVLNVTGGAFTVGYSGGGTVDIAAGGEVDDNSFDGLVLASQQGATGTINDYGSLSVADANLIVGGGGQGALTVEGGGQATAYELIVADDDTSGSLTSDSPSWVTVVGAGSKLTATFNAIVGASGFGALTIEASASASLASLTIADEPSSGSLADTLPSYVDVVGAGFGVSPVTTLTASDITVGANGYGHLAVTSEGYASGASLVVAQDSTAGQSWVLVEGDPLFASVRPQGAQAQASLLPPLQSTLALSGQAVVGNGGTGYAIVEQGGLMSANSLSIAYQYTSGQTSGAGSPSYVEVTGYGNNGINGQLFSQLSVTNAIVVGEGGYGALDVYDGAEAFGGSLVVADQSTSGAYGAAHTASSGDTGLPSFVDVSDPGSTLSISGAATVGNSGYGVVNLLDGGAMSVGSLDIAAQSLSGKTSLYDRSYVEADEAGTSLTVSGNAIVGDGGYGVLTDFNGATTSIGGALTVAAQSTSGSAADDAPDFVEVAGAGASLTVSGAVTVGGAGDGQLVASNSGAFTASGATMEIAAQSGSTGQVVVDDNATLAAAQVVIGGAPTAAGGAGSLDVASAGVVNVASSVQMWGGSINVDSQSSLTIGAQPGTTAGLDIEAGGALTGYGSVAGAVQNDGTIVAENGVLLVDDALTGAGAVQIDSGATFDDKAGVAATETIQFENNAGVSGTLDDLKDGVAATISGFAGTGGTPATSDVIDVAGSGVAGDKVLWNQSTGALTVETGGGLFLDALKLAGDYVQSDFVVNELPNEDQIAYSMPCFVRGTRIATERGEIAVEALRVGDRVRVASGETRTVRWLGRRALNLAHHPNPAAVRPVRIEAHAFGEGQPRRDLWLSPGHNIASEGALVPISALVNGVSIQQLAVARVEYWHVELEAHDVLFAEGLPSESYLDTGNRTDFANGGSFVAAHPDFAPKHWSETCLPLAFEGPPVARAKARALARLFEQGYEIESEAEAHAVVDGRRVAPFRLSAARLAFILPEGGREIVLRSRTFVPAHCLADSMDPRTLGLRVGRLWIDGEAVALEDDALFASGWHGVEGVGEGRAFRWTDGEARLPAGARMVIVDLAGRGHYWREPMREKAARRA